MPRDLVSLLNDGLFKLKVLGFKLKPKLGQQITRMLNANVLTLAMDCLVGYLMSIVKLDT